MKRLIVARHGNTFRPGETPTRVGAKTDLPLVEEVRARAIGKYLKAHEWIPNRVLAAPLKRTIETAELAIAEVSPSLPIIRTEAFTEIDYGPDENQIEDVVQTRLGEFYLSQEHKLTPETTLETVLARGEEALSLWNSQAIVPHGWKVDVPAIIEAWIQVADDIAEDETVLVVSSNGIIRFAPYILGDYQQFCKTYDIKVATGGVSVFECDDKGRWLCLVWNEKAYKLFL